MLIVHYKLLQDKDKLHIPIAETIMVSVLMILLFTLTLIFGNN